MGEKIYKDKFIIVNEEKKILIFTGKRGTKEILFLPSLVQGDCFSDTCLFEAILEEFTMEEFECILELEKKSTRLQSENNKLYQDDRMVGKRYYTCCKELSKEFISKILDVCFENDINVDFLSIEEIKRILNRSHRSLFIENDFDLVINKLEKKINYEEY